MGTSTARAEGPSWYEIRVQGRLEERWARWFDGLALTTGRDGTTTLRGPVVDQAALHGVLGRLRDLGLPILAVTSSYASPEPPTAPSPPAPSGEGGPVSR